MINRIIIGKEYPVVLIDAVKHAKQSILILMYAWRWYDGEVGTLIQQFNNEIIRARQRGVEVRAIVNFDFIQKKLADQKIKIKKIESKKTLHVKMIIIDDQLLFLGSHNLTKNAFEINHEISLVTSDLDSIEKCRIFFNNIF